MTISSSRQVSRKRQISWAWWLKVCVYVDLTLEWESFTASWTTGHPEYGCFISKEKTLTNFDYDYQIMNVTGPWRECRVLVRLSPAWVFNRCSIQGSRGAVIWSIWRISPFQSITPGTIRWVRVQYDIILANSHGAIKICVIHWQLIAAVDLAALSFSKCFSKPSPWSQRK